MAAAFKSVELLKKEVLGIGSYGKVCKAKCDGLICAAKLLLETLFDPSAQAGLDQSSEKSVRRFEQECELMRDIQHPNIVQYLGLCDDSSSGLRALLMELMDESLTAFLKRAPGPLPYHLEVNICHDVSLALSYLHINGIIHRDLSSNNILLTGNARAKVSDFGMARLGDLNPLTSQSIRTKLAGTSAYLPPECHLENPEYTDKVDCFSFGVVMVQILTRLTPEPGKMYEKVEDSKYRSGVILTIIMEVDRRQNHISKISSQHPLRDLALKCLENESGNRPSAQHLCECLTKLKGLTDYTDSKAASHNSISPQENGVNHANGVDRRNVLLTHDVGVNTEKDERIDDLEKQLERCRQQLQQQEEIMKEGDEKKLTERDDLVQQLRLQLEQARSSNCDKDQLIAERERAFAGIEQQLKVRISERDELDKRVHELEQNLKHRDIISLNVCCTKGRKKAPHVMYRSNDTIVDGSTAYFRPARTRKVTKYSQADGWSSKLPDCPFESSPLAIINHLLTTVGGHIDGNRTDKLLSLTGNGKKWTEEFPPMPTKRSHAAALCTGSCLIVAGGRGERGETLKTVEVLDIDGRQWSVAADLPEPCLCFSMTIVDGLLYVLGGVNTNGTQTNLAYACSVDAILDSLYCYCRPPETQNGASSPERRNGTSHSRETGLSPMTPNGTPTHHVNEWRRICNLPVTQTACVSFQGRLLAIGGLVSGDDTPSRNIFVYSIVTNSWEVVGHVIAGRSVCFAAVFADNQLMIVGGYTNSTTVCDSVEFISVV